MPSQIRPTRQEVSDRFPMLGFTIRTDGEGKRYEVVVASNPALFRPEAKPERTRANFYSSRAEGLRPIDRGEAVYVLRPEVLARFAGQDKLYYALATYSNGGTARPEITALPSEGSAYINVRSLSGRTLSRVRILPSRQRVAAGYGNGAGAELEWGGDVAMPGTQPVNGATSAAPAVGPGPSQAASLAYNDGFGPLPWARPQEASDEDEIDAHGIEEPIPDADPLAIPEQQAYSSALQDSEYPQASRFVPAASGNYLSVSKPRKINRIVIHITAGQSKISGTIGWFQNPDQRNKKGEHITVSAHYVIGQDGEVVQMVRHNDRAWHASSANSDSIGIEHVARPPRTFNAKDSGLYPTEAQYCASAALVRWLCEPEQYDLPMDRAHIQGHSEADPKTTHTSCPNSVWDWDYFMGMVKSASCYSRDDAPTSQGLSASYSGYGSGRASAYQRQGYGLALRDEDPYADLGFSFAMRCGESINDRVVRCCREALAGGPMGENDRHDTYREFISAGQEKSPEAAENLTHVKTSCAMFVRAVRLWCGAAPSGPYVPGTGMFISMGNVHLQHPAFVPLKGGATPNPGDWFYMSTNNVDGHTGIFLAQTEDGGWETAEGGGGEDQSLCRINHRQIIGNKFSKEYKTLWGWFDCTKVGLPDSPPCETGDNPSASENTDGYQAAQSLGARAYASSRARAFDAPALEPGDVVKAGGKTYIIYANEVRQGGVYAWINNNPGNITKGKWSEEHGALAGKSHGGFAIFPDETTGFYAIISFIERFPNDTIYQLMTRYAPPDDGKNPMLKGNNPEAYARSIANKLGVPMTTQIKDLSDEQKSIFAGEIQRIETGATGTGKTYAYNDPALPEEIRNRLPARAADSSAQALALSRGFVGALSVSAFFVEAVERMKSEFVANGAAGAARRNCITIANAGLRQLYGASLQNDDGSAKALGSTIQDTMASLQSYGLADTALIFEFLDASGKLTKGVVRPDQLRESVEAWLLSQAEANQASGWYCFGLSLMDGYHSVILTLEFSGTGNPDTRVHWADQIYGGWDDVTGSLDARITSRIQGWWDPLPANKKARTRVTVWPLIP